MYRIKFVDLQILHRLSLLCFLTSLMVLENKCSKNCKAHPLPKLLGNIGPIVMARGGFRFETIDQSVRKVSSDKLFRTHRHTRQAKNQFSARFSDSRVMKRVYKLALLRFFDTIPILPFVLRTWK